MPPHFNRLVSAEPEVRTRLAGTQQGESSFAVFRKICNGIRLVGFARAFHVGRARKAPTLVAKCRKLYALRVCCVPNVLVRSYANITLSSWRDQSDREKFSPVDVIVHADDFANSKECLPVSAGQTFPI